MLQCIILAPMHYIPLFRTGKILLAAALATSAGAAIASPDAQTRLVSCGNDSCLLVTGRRISEDSSVVINGHAIAIEGGRSWRASLPVATIQKYANAYARTIEVTVIRPDGQEEWSADARLPIGLLGHRQLADLVVTAD